MDEARNPEPGPATRGVDAFPFRYALPDGQYICQSTELIRATARLAKLDLASYLRDIRAKTYSVGALIRIVCYALFLRFRRSLVGTSLHVLKGAQSKTPVEALNLQPGEWVQVKTKEEIAATLDREGKNRGLRFVVEMLPFCGGTYRVLRRLEQMIDDPTRRLIKISNTVILENVTCDGCHILRGGCPRDNYHFWREIWLSRVKKG